MKKIILALTLALLLFTLIPQSFAASSILPEAGDAGYCDAIFEYADPGLIEEEFKKDGSSWDSLLGCAIQNGKIQFWMVKYFVVYALEFLLSIAALLSILMIIVGAYYYIAGGLTDDKEKGKTIIKYAIGGLVLATLSWVIVNVLLLALTA